VDSQSDRDLKYMRLGCETQWVRKYSIQGKIKSLTYISITYVAFHWKLFHEFGFAARPVRHLGQIEG